MLNIENTKNRLVEAGRANDRVSIYSGANERSAHTRTLNAKNTENRQAGPATKSRPGASIYRSVNERSQHRSLARPAKCRYILAYEKYTLANNAKPINFQFQQARIADRVCASLDRHSRSLPIRSFSALANPVITLKVKPTCNFRSDKRYR